MHEEHPESEQHRSHTDSRRSRDGSEPQWPQVTFEDHDHGVTVRFRGDLAYDDLALLAEEILNH